MSADPPTPQASLLRGINVGTANRIGMETVREIYAGIGAQDVVTLLNSGNVVLRHTGSPEAVSRLAEAGIREKLGFDIVVIGRSHHELAQIAAAVDLFPDAAPNQRFVVFLDRLPVAGGVHALRASATDREELLVIGRELHMHLRDGIGRSKLTLPLIEKRLAVRGTARNWNTLTKLVELTRPGD